MHHLQDYGGERYEVGYSSAIAVVLFVIMIGANFYAIMPGRLVQFAIMTPIYCVLTSLLYFSPLTGMVVGNVRPAKLEKKTV